MSDNRDSTVVFALNWNGTEKTCALLRSLRKARVSLPVWIVDNGSQKDDSDQFKLAFPGVEVLRIQENQGFAGGVNWAIREANRRGFCYAYEINNDCIVDSDPVTPCVRLAELHPDTFAIGSRNRFFASDGTPGKWGPESNPDSLDWEPDGFRRSESPSGCAVLFRIEPFLLFGGLDERFHCYDEETDLFWRAGDAGFKCATCLDSFVFHYHQGSDINGNAIYYRTRNRFLLKRKHLFDRPVYAIGTAASFLHVVLNSFPKDFDTWGSWTQGVLHALIFRYGRRSGPPSHWLVLLFPLLVAIFGLAQMLIQSKHAIVKVFRSDGDAKS